MKMTLEELKEQQIWCNYDNAKIPFQCDNGYGAKSNDTQTWSAYQQAADNVKNQKVFNIKVKDHAEEKVCIGIGLMLSPLNNGYALAGIDIDGHKNGDNPLATEILKLFSGTYAERSPSGTGYHVLFLVNLKDIGEKWDKKYYIKNSRLELECYIAGLTSRYLTFTENIVCDCPLTDKTDALKIFLERYMLKPQSGTDSILSNNVALSKPAETLKTDKQQLHQSSSFDNLLDIARNAKNGDKFKALYDCGSVPAGKSHSEADFSLCCMLAFYLQGDYDKIDIAFRSSALYREKWEREDYRSATIHRSIEKCNGKFYTPKNLKKDNEEKLPELTYDGFEEYLMTHGGYSITFNVIKKRLEYVGFSNDINPQMLPEVAATELTKELKKCFDKVAKADVIDYIMLHASKHTYNPILCQIEKEFTAGELGERESGWDKVDRISQIYDMLQIDKGDTLSRSLIKKWLMQTYCVLFNDHLDYPFAPDIVLVLQGEQGIGKSRLVEKLALSPTYFKGGACIDTRNKDSIMEATSKWITELGEIGSTLRKDIDSVKAFLTLSTDEYRSPYGRASCQYPRTTSFVGTVNDDQFLIDKTGNRRFATIPIKYGVYIDVEKQLEPFNALQLWVQVKCIVDDEINKGRTYANCWRLTRDEIAQLEKRNSPLTKKTKGEQEVEDVIAWCEMVESNFETGKEWTTITNFKMCHSELKNLDSSVIGKILTNLGFEKRIIDKHNHALEYFLPYKRYTNQFPHRE